MPLLKSIIACRPAGEKKNRQDRPGRCPSAVASAGFTLIEILVVMTIAIILLALSLQIGSAWEAQKLSTQARQLAAELSQAVLLAQKDNHPVEIRFYRMPDETGNGSGTALRAFQLVRLNGYDPQNGAPIYRLLNEATYFDGDIMLHESPDYTSVMALPVREPDEHSPSLRGARRSYVSFIFLPDGTTTLPRTPDAVFTLVKENEHRDLSELPPNYRSVVLQPVTGKAAVY